MENNNEFNDKLCKAMAAIYPEAKVCVRRVLKNNGIVRYGLSVQTADSKLSPVIYLEPFEALYNDGMTLGEITARIAHFLDMQSYSGISIDEYLEYGAVKDRIAYKVINYELNKELLESVPYIRWNDLAICFYYVFDSDDDGYATILVRNDHLKLWKVDTDELFELASRNTPRLMEDDLDTLASTLRLLLPDEERFKVDEAVGDDPALDMYVLTNKSRIFGATCILYSDCIRRLAQRYNTGLYILPSSIHEVIIIPASRMYDEEYMKEMICEVNDTELSPDEKLSDNLYYYDPDRDLIRIA